MKSAEDDELMFVISTLAISELVKINGVEPKNQRDTIVAFLENDYFDVHGVDRTIAQRAQDLRREHPLDTADAVHLATAVVTNTHLFLTRDGDSRKAKRKILPLDNKISCLDGQRLRIMTLKGYLESEDAKLTPLLYVNSPDDASQQQTNVPISTATPQLRLSGQEG